MRLRGSDARWARRSHTSLGPKAKFPEFRGRQAVRWRGGRSGIPGPRNPGDGLAVGEADIWRKKMSSARQR